MKPEKRIIRFIVSAALLIVTLLFTSEHEDQLLRIPLEDGRFERVSTSLVEIEYY